MGHNDGKGYSVQKAGRAGDRPAAGRLNPPLLPEVYAPEAPCFFAWDARRYAAYVRRARETGHRPLTPREYLTYAIDHYALADVLLLYWDSQDVKVYRPVSGRPSDGYLEGRLGDSLLVLRIRVERWDLLLSTIAPDEMVRPLHPVNGQQPGESLWERFFRSREAAHEPNPWWRLHVWTKLMGFYGHVRYDRRHPWYPFLAQLPLQLPWDDPSPVVADSVRGILAPMAI